VKGIVGFVLAVISVHGFEVLRTQQNQEFRSVKQKGLDKKHHFFISVKKWMHYLSQGLSGSTCSGKKSQSLL